MKEQKQLPKLTRKQAAFVGELLADKKISATQAVKRSYNTTTDLAARAIAHENLTKPNILAHLEANSVRAEQKIVNLLEDKKSEIQLAAAKDILDRVHGKATQKVETTTTGVTLSIDLTSALTEVDEPS